MTTHGHERRVLAAIEGSDEALTELMRIHYERLRRIGVRACGDQLDAEDAVQEAFIKLARRPDVQRDRGALSWLMTTVRNTCLRILRRWRFLRSAPGEVGVADTVAASGSTPEESLDRWRLIHRLHRLIAALPRDQREVLILRDIEGQPAGQVCASLGLTEAAMKSRLHRARGQLRDRLIDHGRDSEDGEDTN